ncbi:M1 family metallopeptidase [Mucilaginibacter auburnensis]|uniref:Peptidase M1 membrane alanine aminopeptidase domain-containing protein n=1 Tax=Mucilaginibacter auburnensis TaxID=1457233 RepID=A0A2H9VVH7_9SPHI|nr:M1 family metallopeptidase [Mucilaginibacter auburnensis]PJJ84817.1 hypothetical protein CLV57_1839 [Mucilaginibacter auburnensis]
MKKYLFLPALACSFFMGAKAQKLTIPERIAPSYTNGTRTTDGKPGKNWWQNRARYEINVNVAPPNKLVSGTEHIVYFNNSPHRLDSLNMKLIVNVHRAGRRNAAPNIAQGVTVDQLKINGTPAVWDNAAATTTNYMLPLPKALMPKDSVAMDITWHFEIADGKDRDGAIDPTTYFLAYFYPRVAVFDDYQGWDKQPHTGSLEFYNDFNDYTLNVTAPKNFVVWATGTHTNPDQVLQPEYAKRFKASLISDSTIRIVTPEDLASKNITAQNATNTWTFTSKNISDVTAAISDHYNWDAGSVELDSKTHRRVSAQAAYDNSAQSFARSVQFSRYSLKWFSDNWPGIPYPFEKSVAVHGYADMEYPMMMNDSKQTDATFAQLVQDHEQAHTYMPFYMGINESRYAFMDEGWATTFEYLIGISEKGQKAADEFYKAFRVNGWTRGKHDQENPIITPSPEVTFSPGSNAYGKPSLSYLALKDYLGDALFKKALHYYMNNWNGKHPIPWDYFNAMKAGSGKNLDWFFYNWFYTPSYIDLTLLSVTKTGSDAKIEINNKGGFAIPFDVNVTYTDGSTETFHQTPAVWEKDQKNISLKLKASKELKEVKLDGGIFVDANAIDNTWKN